MTNKIYLFAATSPLAAKEISAALTFEGSRRFFALLGKKPCRVEKEPSGKPVFAGGEYFLSLSHSENAFLAAFSEIPVGVDLEKRGKVRAGVVAKYFSATERERDFFSCWTGKEAVSKLTGDGLSALARIHLEGDGAEFGGKKYYLRDLSGEFPVKGFAATLAAGEAETELVWL